MNVDELQKKVNERIETHRPAFEARWPNREVEFVVLSHFGRAVMDLLIDKGGVPAETVRDFTLNRIREINPDLRADLVPDGNNKEFRASVQLGIEQIGEDFPDLLFIALQNEWNKVDQEWETGK